MSEKILPPSVSVIINTDGRAKSLATCLESLRYLRYPNFEVVVVAGPTRDGTHELCRSYGQAIKFAECPARNLSQSRNISVEISSGEFVAFLDDDSVPEPEWLDDIMPVFSDPAVAVAGGFLHDHTGKTYQWTFGTLNRFGTADLSWKTPAPEFNFPGSFNYPHVMANSVFRRSAIAEVGGFDEEYEYFLDESDIILRFVDAGFKVAQLDKGFVHHKYMPSHLRNEARFLTSWYSVIKNKTYFSLLNAKEHATLSEILSAVNETIEEFRKQVHWGVSVNKLDSSCIERFEDEVNRALHDGLKRGLNGVRKTAATERMRGVKTLTKFDALLGANAQRCLVFLSRTYPPGDVGGIGRYVHQLATELGKLGHQVHVLTSGVDHDRVDFEDGVWVHRICIKELAPPDHLVIPRHLWNYSRTMFGEAVEIAKRRTIDAVFAPIWDLEGVAFLDEKKFPLITSLHTTLASYLASNPEKSADELFFRSFAEPVLDLEKRLLIESDGVLANSVSIVEEIQESYSIKFDTDRLEIVPHGLRDWSTLEIEAPPPLSAQSTRICFIGRLEYRKGADVFLAVVPDLLKQYPMLHIDIVGDDSIPAEGHKTFRTGFEVSNSEACRSGRVSFHGNVSDARLRGFYASADVVVAPSRFESFGLVHLEAMIFGKPVVGCAVGGMKEVIQDGETGLLAEPGDSNSLFLCLSQLIESKAARDKMGAAARKRYLALFQATIMAGRVARMVERFGRHLRTECAS